MRAIDRMAFVIYAFLLAESFNHMKGSKDRVEVHFIKLLFLAIISEITYMIFLNICYNGYSDAPVHLYRKF